MRTTPESLAWCRHLVQSLICSNSCLVNCLLTTRLWISIRHLTRIEKTLAIPDMINDTRKVKTRLTIHGLIRLAPIHEDPYLLYHEILRLQIILHCLMPDILRARVCLTKLGHQGLDGSLSSNTFGPFLSHSHVTLLGSLGEGRKIIQELGIVGNLYSLCAAKLYGGSS